MKTEKEKMEEIFNNNMEALYKSGPDFDSMWKDAESSARNKGHFTWKIAASVALLFTVGAAVVLYQRGDKNQTSSSVQIESWIEPTKGLIDTRPGSSTAVLTEWSSPTDFLLPQSSQSTK